MTDTTMIFNGGDPLKDCPRDFEAADAWAANANGDNDKFDSPMWRWDCGFKLDYDGPLLRFSGRFYPPKTHYGDKWDGKLQVIVMGKPVLEKDFECETLDELKKMVESFASDLRRNIVAHLIDARKGADRGEP